MIICIGDFLCDFIVADEGSSIEDAQTFTKSPGGAIANVAACLGRLYHSEGKGNVSYLATVLGEDNFGSGLLETIRGAYVDTSFVFRSAEANTMLVFISKTHPRQVMFYNKHAAHLLFGPEHVQKMATKLLQAYAFFFGSTSLVPSSMQEAHRQALKLFTEQNRTGIVCYDPNVRTGLWSPSRYNEYRALIFEFMPFAHVLKIADDELPFLCPDKHLYGTDYTSQSFVQELETLFFGGKARLLLLTKGEDGANLYAKDDSGNVRLLATVSGHKVVVVDVTGAGDAFIGSFMFGLERLGINRTCFEFASLDEHLAECERLLVFSNAVAALSTLSCGGIAGMPTIPEIRAFAQKMNISACNLILGRE